jgi:hypothetical protein
MTPFLAEGPKTLGNKFSIAEPVRTTLTGFLFLPMSKITQVFR